MLGALGANIPNYAASIVAIAGREMEVGLGIIIGSNIYNIAIILGIVTFAVPQRHGVILKLRMAHDVHTVALYTLTGMLTTLCGVWLLPGTPLASLFRAPLLFTILLTIAMVTMVALFGGLIIHALRRTHHDHDESLTVPMLQRIAQQKWVSTVPLRQLLIWIGEALLALLTALGAVVIMVQSGQSLTLDLHMSQVLAGLLVLAVATSLPNTIVAFMLAQYVTRSTSLVAGCSAYGCTHSSGVALCAKEARRPCSWSFVIIELCGVGDSAYAAISYSYRVAGRPTGTREIFASNGLAGRPRGPPLHVGKRTRRDM